MSQHMLTPILTRNGIRITVCGGANESCPMFTGKVRNRLHIGFDDPSEATGSPEFINSEFIGYGMKLKPVSMTFT